MGRKSLIPISDDELRQLYLDHSSSEIAKKFGAPYRSAYYRLHRMGIFEKHKNDSNPEKYNKNHTPQSYEKMRQTILLQYQLGRTAWNEGLRADEDERVRRMSQNLTHRNGCGPENSNWNPSLTQEDRERKRYSPEHKEWARLVKERENYTCQCCRQRGGELVSHHLNSYATFVDQRLLVLNGACLCQECHLKFHSRFGNSGKNTEIEFQTFEGECE